jgi:hypothetical protein
MLHAIGDLVLSKVSKVDLTLCEHHYNDAIVTRCARPLPLITVYIIYR